MIDVTCLPKGLEDYDELLDPGVGAEIRSLAASLRGLRVVHVNATPAGGGVAEILRSLVPMMQGLVIDAHWYVVEPYPAFFNVTKKVHNGLQGKAVQLAADEIALYLARNQRLAEELRHEAADADLLVLHDPQVLPALSYLGRDQVVWHCHLDSSTPDPQTRELVVPFTRSASRYIVSMPSYVMDGIPRDRISVISPAIDPLSPKNAPLPPGVAVDVLSGLGLDLTRPLMTQVSRFDPWKDPWGVIDVYRLAKRDVPELQLALVGALVARDDPEGVEMLESVRRHAGDDPDIHIYSDAADGADIPVNAFQSLSTVVVQKSLREGFGLTVTEAMWKGAAVVGGRCGGIQYQIQDGVSGYLVTSPQECAERVVELIRRPQARADMGSAARERVRQQFLMPRLLLDYLRLFREMTQGGRMGVAGDCSRTASVAEGARGSPGRLAGRRVRSPEP